VNSRTFKDLWNKIQGLSSTCPVFKYFQGLEFRGKNSSTFKDFQGCVGTLLLTFITENINFLTQQLLSWYDLPSFK